MTARGGGEEISRRETTLSFFLVLLILHLTPPLTLSRPFFSSSYFTRPRRGQRIGEGDTHTHTNICTHPGLTDRNHYKSSRPYRGQHTDKYVSTPHPTDPSPKTSVTPRRKMWKYIHVNVRNGRLMIQPNPVAH